MLRKGPLFVLDNNKFFDNNKLLDNNNFFDNIKFFDSNKFLDNNKSNPRPQTFADERAHKRTCVPFCPAKLGGAHKKARIGGAPK